MISKSKFESVREYSTTESSSSSEVKAGAQASPVYAFQSKFIVGKIMKTHKSTDHARQLTPTNNQNDSKNKNIYSAATSSNPEYNGKMQKIDIHENSKPQIPIPSQFLRHLSIHTNTGLQFVKDNFIDNKSIELSKLKAVCDDKMMPNSNLNDLLKSKTATGTLLKPDEFRRLQKAGYGLFKPVLLKSRFQNLSAGMHIENHGISDIDSHNMKTRKKVTFAANVAIAVYRSC